MISHGRATQILLQPQNPLDLQEEDLEGLAQSLHATGYGEEVSLAYFEQPEGTFGVTWWEVLTVWVPQGVIGAAIGELMRRAATWMQRRREKQDPVRPISVTFVRYQGEKGEVLEILKLEQNATEVERETPQDSHPRQRPPIREGNPPERFFNDSE